MVDAGRLDGVLVCVPSTMHLETVKTLIAAHLPILCEKPVGVTADQGLLAARLAAHESLPLQVGFWRRFVPSLCCKAAISSFPTTSRFLHCRCCVTA